MTIGDWITAAVALVGAAAGLISLYQAAKKNKQEAQDAENDNARADFMAGNSSAETVTDTALKLMQPLRERVDELERQGEQKDKKHREEILDLQMRLTAAERRIEELIKINEDLVEREAKAYRERDRALARIAELRKTLGGTGNGS